MQKLLAVSLLSATAIAARGASAQTISYVNFSNTAGLQINGNAFQNGNKLTLTPANYNQGGSVFSTLPVQLTANASFSTLFNFDIQSRGGLGGGADGLTFTMQTGANNVGGAAPSTRWCPRAWTSRRFSVARTCSSALRPVRAPGMESTTSIRGTS